MFSRRKRQQSGPPEEAPSPTTDYFRLARIRLYQPDDILASRLRNGVDELAAYCETLVWVGREYFGRLGQDFGSLGVLIAVGIKPNRKTKLWCDVVDGQIPRDVWEAFVNLLQGAGNNIRPEVTEPVACALECLVGVGPSIPFPAGPMDWQRAAAEHEVPLSVPDELFKVVFAD